MCISDGAVGKAVKASEGSHGTCFPPGERENPFGLVA
jgi:hypothetical protein